MKLLFAFTISLLTVASALAQVKAVYPLPCNTWGPDQFLTYEEAQRLTPPDPPSKYKYTSIFTPSADSYQSFGKDRGVYFWMPEQNHYINNVQVIRWTIVNKNIPFEFIIHDIYDEEIYTASSANSCGIIVFPDSVDTQMKEVIVKIKATGDYSLRSGMATINFDHVVLKPKDEEERRFLLNDLKACSNLACKVEILKAQHATLDLLSLLELEKIKDPTNKEVDKLYWEIVSIIRYGYCGQSWER